MQRGELLDESASPEKALAPLGRLSQTEGGTVFHLSERPVPEGGGGNAGC